MSQPDPVVFPLDVNNTLLDNDQVYDDLQRRMTQAIGVERQQRYWAIFEAPRAELGYTDYLGALRRYRVENPRDPHFVQVSFYLLAYPFADRLLPAALEVIERIKSWGQSVILSDGDVIFQPRKVERSGLYQAVESRVLIHIHKERQLDDVEGRYPARHYVLVDDKLRILDAVKKVWGPRLTTVFPRQGHYAHDPKALATYPPADVTIDHIGDLSGPTCPPCSRPLGRQHRGAVDRSIPRMTEMCEEPSTWPSDTTGPCTSCPSTTASPSRRRCSAGRGC